MRLWCWGVFKGIYVDSDGLWCVFRWIYVDGFNGAGGEVRVFWICDVPVSYAETVDYGYGSAGPGAQMCGAGFWVSK